LVAVAEEANGAAFDVNVRPTAGGIVQVHDAARTPRPFDINAGAEGILGVHGLADCRSHHVEVGIARTAEVEPTAILGVFLDHGDDLVLAQTAPALEGVAKMERWAQALLDVDATDAARELIKLKLARCVVGAMVVEHHVMPTGPALLL